MPNLTKLQAVGLGVLGTMALAAAPPTDLPEKAAKLEGFQRILERGAIPAIRDPKFVRAAEARIPDDAWVVGVSDGKVAKAYSINLLNRHEVVNDTLGDQPIATTW